MNIELILRMIEHGYTVQDIHLRLRHRIELIELVIQNHEKWKREVEQQ
jgi:hypothetical protein